MTCMPKETRLWLLERARSAILHAVAAGRAPTTPDLPPTGAEVLAGCFVSLHTRAGALRGCIGTFAETRPLWQAVDEMAAAAATQDPRFPTVAARELADIVLEISALTPCKAAKPEDVLVGRDGICVARGYQRGVLLPQVATDRGWDAETFLDHTCVKAGLPANAWRDGSVQIETFTAEVFSEGNCR